MRRRVAPNARNRGRGFAYARDRRQGLEQVRELLGPRGALGPDAAAEALERAEVSRGRGVESKASSLSRTRVSGGAAAAAAGGAETGAWGAAPAAFLALVDFFLDRRLSLRLAFAACSCSSSSRSIIDGRPGSQASSSVSYTHLTLPTILRV